MTRSKDERPQKVGEVLALIPARGGSKSVPGKNLRALLGKPLLAYSIEHALQCPLIDRVIVTTDSAEIAAVARAHGAEAPFLRPAEISTDHSLDVEFHHHALEWLRDMKGIVLASWSICGLPIRCAARRRLPARSRPSPLLRTRNSLRSVRAADKSPFKMWRIDEQGYAVPVARLEKFGEPYNMPRQLLPVVYWQDCYVDITRPEVVFEQKSTTGQLILPFLIEEECVDIDYEDELVLAERLLARLALESPAKKPPTPRYPR